MMSFKNIFSNFIKSLGGNSQGGFLLPASMGGGSNYHEPSVHSALKLWQQVAPLKTAINTIIKDFKTIQPFLFDQRKKEFIDEHAALNLLNSPNPYQGWEDLSEALITDGLVCGNYYFAVTYEGQKAILIERVNPLNITVEKGRNGYPESLRYQSENASEYFEVTSGVGGVRYVNSNGDKAIFIKQFYNPFSNTKGLGVVASLFYPIMQYLLSEEHNLGSLKNGGRLSLLINCMNTLTDEQRASLKNQINGSVRGPQNAGQILLIDGDKFDIKEYGQNLKDMDFVQLKDRSEQAIYKQLQIPLPLVSTENMTYDNYSQSNIVLMEKVVLSLSDDLFAKVSAAILPSFNVDYQNIYFTYNTAKIPVLQEKNYRTLKILKEAGIATINELRGMIGLPAITGGDVLYQSAADIPLGTSFSFDDSEQSKRLKIKQFLSAQRDEKGLALYSASEIESKISEAFKNGNRAL